MPFAALRERMAAAITAFTDAVAARVAPALPWIYLALRRALIPTLVWLVVAALFFVVPQSREVLHGLSEPVLQSFAEFDRTDRSSINLWALISYVATAVVLGFAIWYSARLLSTVDADRAAVVHVAGYLRARCEQHELRVAFGQSIRDGVRCGAVIHVEKHRRPVGAGVHQLPIPVAHGQSAPDILRRPQVGSGSQDHGFGIESQHVIR